jgi:hypothetical protein
MKRIGLHHSWSRWTIDAMIDRWTNVAGPAAAERARGASGWQ